MTDDKGNTLRDYLLSKHDESQWPTIVIYPSATTGYDETVDRVAKAIEPLIRRAHPIDDWDEREIAEAAIKAMIKP